VADISPYESQQLGVVICVVMRKSQRANHAIMEIRNIRSINHNDRGYLCTWKSIKTKGGNPKE